MTLCQKEIEFQTLENSIVRKTHQRVYRELGRTWWPDQNSQRTPEKNAAQIWTLKKSELQSIIEETEKEEENLISKSKANEKLIEDRLLIAYKRIRKMHVMAWLLCK